jgi:hypothetical protein
MHGRLNVIGGRARLVFGGCLASLILPWILHDLGIAEYDPVPGMENRPDRSVIERACLAWEWMWAGTFFVWACAKFRVRYATLFSATSRTLVARLAGLTGIAILMMSWFRWAERPFTGRQFSTIEGWEFGVGWLLFWWYYVFRPEKGSGHIF